MICLNCHTGIQTTDWSWCPVCGNDVTYLKEIRMKRKLYVNGPFVMETFHLEWHEKLRRWLRSLFRFS